MMNPDWTKIDALRKDFVFTWNQSSTSAFADEQLENKGYTQIGIVDERIQPINRLADSSIVLPLALQVIRVTSAIQCNTNGAVRGQSPGLLLRVLKKNLVGHFP